MRAAHIGAIAASSQQSADGGGGSGAVSFIAASGTTYATGTSQNQTIPANAQEGDLLLAFVMHRDTITPPSGWTLVASQVCSNSTVTQYTSVYKRVAQSGDAGASTTWGQATSQRLAVHIHAYRKSGGCDVIDSSTAVENNKNSLSNVFNWASLSSTVDGAMGVAACSSIISSNPPASTTVTPSTGTMTTPLSIVENRLGVVYLARDDGQSLSGTFTASFLGTNNNGIASVSVLVG